MGRVWVCSLGPDVAREQLWVTYAKQKMLVNLVSDQSWVTSRGA